MRLLVAVGYHSPVGLQPVTDTCTKGQEQIVGREQRQLQHLQCALHYFPALQLTLTRNKGSSPPRAPFLLCPEDRDVHLLHVQGSMHLQTDTLGVVKHASRITDGMQAKALETLANVLGKTRTQEHHMV